MLCWLVLVLSLQLANTMRVCSNYPNYYFNINCHDNTDAEMEVPEIIRKYGFQVQTYNVTTDDGYNLQIFRIPSSNRTPIFFQHGITLSSLAWLAAAKDSLVFLLASAGFDIWLGNFRGTRYGQTHRSLTEQDPQFWNYSFHELGAYDVAAQVRLVYQETGLPLYYIGQSMGTTAGYVYAITYPEESSRLLKIMIDLTPVAYLNIKSSVALIAPFARLLVKPLTALSGGVLFRQTPTYRRLLRALCTVFPFQMKACWFLQMTIFGFDPAQIDPEKAPVQLMQLSDAVSVKVIYHYACNINADGKFLRYDYGREGNIRVYGSEKPPSINVSEIRVPVYLVYGQNDILATKENVLRLYRDLPAATKTPGVFTPEYRKFSHLDFLIANDVKPLLYDHLVRFIRSLRL